MLLDIVIFALGCIYLISAFTLKLAIRRMLGFNGILFLLLSMVSFCLVSDLRIVEAVCLLFFMLYSALNLIACFSGKRTSCPQVICVPGARVWPNRRVCGIFQNRLDLACELYHKFNDSPLIAVCGAAGADEPVSEAAAGAEYLLSRGIPSDKIIIEPNSCNTIGSFRNLSELLPEKNAPVLVATSSWGLLRAKWLAQKAGLNAKVRGARSTFLEYMSYSLREIFAIGYFLFTGVGK